MYVQSTNQQLLGAKTLADISTRLLVEIAFEPRCVIWLAPLDSLRCSFFPDFRVRFADFWRVCRVRMNFGRISEVSGGC